MSDATHPKKSKYASSPELKAADQQEPIAEEHAEGIPSELKQPLTPIMEINHQFPHCEETLPADSGAFVPDVSTNKFRTEEYPTVPDSKPTNLAQLAPAFPDFCAAEADHLLPKRTPSKISSFFRRSRSSTLEAIQHITNPHSAPDPSGPTSTARPPLSPAASYVQYLGHSAEQSENSHSTKSSTCSNESTTNTTAEPWHLSKARIHSKGMDLSIKHPNVIFANSLREERPEIRHHSGSTSHTILAEMDNYDLMLVATGIGLKARRLSSTVPTEFHVDTVKLHDEYTSRSIVPGRRGKLVGKGSTATVKLMVRKKASTEKVFAVKEFRKIGQHENEDEYLKKVKSEYTIAKSLCHPNIVESVRLCTHGGRWNHVMEFCSQGELFSLVQKNYLTLDDNLCLFKQLLRGVAHLHGHGIAHRDIKLENLLMTSEGHLKITDFGVSEVFRGEHPGSRRSSDLRANDTNECRLSAPGICGSLPYIAPEVIDKAGAYDPRPPDVWSCAIVLMSMIYKGNPWPAADHSHPHQNYACFLSGWDAFIDENPDGLITGSETPSCGPLFSKLPKPVLRNLVLRMLHPNPTKRIDIDRALGDRWVKTIECCCLDGSGARAVVDASSSKGGVGAGKRMEIQRKHDHLPPRESRLPSGLGWL